ncbi:ATP-dependent DNA helicase RecQ-like [Ostrea edulis]|uniref:ATP-dependent DNA helicase RecQ-like n=1 Tax=Ostrea edulis TaxID=37623 RepID=UPI002094CA93|nr:ATP-dependent DNA helicase RecQ-like [Ostrea edulis]
MAMEEKIKLCLNEFQIPALKEEQRKILDALLEKRDCLAILPTGFGKSLPYQLLVPLRRCISPDADTPKVLVCAPLIALMEDQVERLKRIKGVRAFIAGKSSDCDDEVKKGQFDYLFGSPELLVGSSEWRSYIHGFNIQTIVIDEFHTIATWGEKEKEDKEAFRKWFGCVGELRSLLPEASVLALSATCTNKIKKRVLKVLSLKAGLLTIQISPNKPNIKLCVEKVPHETDKAFSWIVDSILDGSLQRTLLYCTSINDCSKIYSYLTSELQALGFMKYIEMYHSETPDDKKQTIIEALQQENSQLKLIIATNALGMGIDIRKCHGVIIYGAAKSVLDMVQEIGRVGRDGHPSVALFLYHGYHLSKASEDVKGFLKEQKCHRLTLMGNFLNDEDLKKLELEEVGRHTCCAICHALCKCEKCTYTDLERAFGYSNSHERQTQSESDTHSESDAD